MLPMPWFASSNIHTPCFHFSLTPPLLGFFLHPLTISWPPHHITPTPTPTLPPTPSWKKHPPSQQCTVTRDETFSPQETSCSETLWLKCVFSWDMERRAGGGFQRWWRCGTWAKWRPCWCIFTACQSGVRWCVGALCYGSGEDEGSCGAAAEVAVVGNGVGVCT